jgi:hypothetical protein
LGGILSTVGPDNKELQPVFIMEDASVVPQVKAMLNILCVTPLHCVTLRSLSKDSELVFFRTPRESPKEYCVRLKAALDLFEFRDNYLLSLFQNPRQRLKGLVKAVNEENEKIVYLLAECPKMPHALLLEIGRNITVGQNYYSLINVGGTHCIIFVITA